MDQDRHRAHRLGGELGAARRWSKSEDIPRIEQQLAEIRALQLIKKGSAALAAARQQQAETDAEAGT